MRKSFYIAVFSAALAGVSYADAKVTTAGPPALVVTGKVTGYGIGGSQKKRTDGVSDFNLGTKGDLRFNIQAMTEGGTEYGAVATLDLRRQKATTKDFIKAAYVYASFENIGFFQLGELEGASKQTVLSGADLLGGTGGFFGDMWTVANPTAGAPIFYDPQSYDKYATKLVYKTPVILGGLQLAFSYTPHSKSYGTLDKTQSEGLIKEVGKDKTPGLKRHWSVAASYGFSVGDAAVNLYVGGDTATPVVPSDQSYTLHSVKTYQAGFLIDYADFQFAGGVINNQRSMMNKNEIGNAGTLYNVAAAYGCGPNNFAIGYMGARRRVKGGHARTDVGSFTYERKVAPGLTVFGEANYFRTRAAQAYLKDVVNGKDAEAQGKEGFLYTSTNNKNNSGTVFLVGTTLRF